MTVNLLEFPVGAELPRHEHARSTEILYVVAGEGKLTVGSEDYPFASDSVLVLPAGQPHAIKFIGPRRPTRPKTTREGGGCSIPGFGPRDRSGVQPGRANQVRGQDALHPSGDRSMNLDFTDEQERPARDREC